MAQRGGSVVAHLRYGAKVQSPLIEPGTADIVVAFEEMEAVRYLPFLHQQSRVVVNTQQILPSAVATGKMTYPENVLAELATRHIALTAVDAAAVARELGELRAVNMVMVGVLSTFLPVAEGMFIDTLQQRIPERFRAVNLKAFQKGREISVISREAW